MSANTTIQNEYGKLEKCFLKSIESSFCSQDQIDAEWRQLNYLAPPDFQIAKDEYRRFEHILLEEGVEIINLPPGEAETMDSLYCRDASILTDSGAILCQMGKPARRGEPACHEKAYQNLGINVLGEVAPPGVIEGGDVAWVDSETLAVGHGYRTNQLGYDQLKELLSNLDITLIQVDLPHYRGSGDVFHLMSIFSPVDRDLAVVFSPLMPVRFRNILLDRGYRLVEVTEEEFEGMGCNVLSLAPRKCLIMEGLPIIRKSLEAAGCQVVSYAGQHISYLGGGGPTCLTRPIRRKQ